MAVGAIFGYRPSTRAKPIPLGRSMTLPDGWVIKVVSATIDATAEIVAIPGNSPPPPGAQYTIVELSATYTGGGSRVLYAGRFPAYGAAYNFPRLPSNQKPPPPMLSLPVRVHSRQTVSGNLCYEIPSADAASLELLVGSDIGGQAWFALR
jgi:hypothetical protein